MSTYLEVLSSIVVILTGIRNLEAYLPFYIIIALGIRTVGYRIEGPDQGAL